MIRGAAWRLAASLALLAALGAAAAPEALRIGSKRFTESYVLGEILEQASTRAGVPSQHRPGLGNTAILFAALRSGAIDAYPEYTGTIAAEILKAQGPLDLAEINAGLAPLGVAASIPLGFSNSFALGVREDQALRDNLRRIGDLARVPRLTLGLSHEFLGRRDGWPGLRAAYSLPQSPVGLDHGVAYEALNAGQVAAIDVYTTDAKLARGNIVILEDDRRFFPRYDAVILHRADAPKVFPRAFAAFATLEGRIDETKMRSLNARAEIDHVPFEEVAREFLDASPAAQGAPQRQGLWKAIFARDFGRLTRQHAGLVFGSLLAAILIGIPLGVLAAKVRAVAQPVLVLTGIAQTIPSLALLAMLIPLTGMIGAVPALIALFLYGLLPIVRNTHAGLLGVPKGQGDAARALGLTPRTILMRIELPLALPTILAGIKTAAVIGVGTATIAAFVGAGGYGERIAQGLALNDNEALLAGAIPAAVFALLVHGVFELIEHLAGPHTWNSSRDD